MIQPNSPYRVYRTRSLIEIYPTKEDWLKDYNYSGIPTTISIERASTLYYLLLSRHCDDHILNSNEGQFKLQLWSIVYSYGPYWDKQLEIQEELRKTDISTFQEGTTAINNTAYNPGAAPSVDAFEALKNISQQTGTKYKKSKVEAYATKMELLKEDVTTPFLNKFNKLFTDASCGPLLYDVTEYYDE